jgi:hypothetical protein
MGEVKVYPIVYPAISSAGLYLFTTDGGVDYEVRFGRKQNNILHATVVFGVTNDEYEGEEYVETNKGELYRVMATVVAVVKIFLKEHPNLKCLEFTGVTKKNESDKKSGTRIKLYYRYLPQIFDNTWIIKAEENTIVVNKKLFR